MLVQDRYLGRMAYLAELVVDVAVVLGDTLNELIEVLHEAPYLLKGVVSVADDHNTGAHIHLDSTGSILVTMAG